MNGLVEQGLDARTVEYQFAVLSTILKLAASYGLCKPVQRAGTMPSPFRRAAPGLHRPYDAASLRIVNRAANWYSTVRASKPCWESPFTHCWMVRWWG